MSEKLERLTPDRRESIVVNQSGNYERRQEIVEDLSAQRRQEFQKISQAIWFVFSIIEILIGLRIVLKLIGANPGNSFAGLIYNVTALFLSPFFGLISNPSAENMVLEVSSIMGMIVYMLLAWGLVKLVKLFYHRSTTSSVTTYERDQTTHIPPR